MQDEAIESRRRWNGGTDAALNGPGSAARNDVVAAGKRTRYKIIMYVSTCNERAFC